MLYNLPVESNSDSTYPDTFPLIPSKEKEAERKQIESATVTYLASGKIIKRCRIGECGIVLPIENKHIVEEGN